MATPHTGTVIRVFARRPSIALVAGALLAVSACRGSAGVVIDRQAATPIAAATAPAAPTPAPTPEPDPPGRAPLPDGTEIVAGDRLAVETPDGQLVTIRPDGTNLIALTDPGEATRNGQATWSPDGNRLAWATVDPTGGAHVRAARFDGTSWSDTAVPVQPVALAWDPTGTQIAALSAGGEPLELGIVGLGDRSGYQAIDSGAPLFFSWGPDGDALLVHASGIRLDFVPTDGSPPNVLERRPGSFQTPAWLAGPTPLVYADEQSGQDYLVVAGNEGAGRRALISYDGYLQYAVSPASGFIALQVLDESAAPTPRAITVSYHQPRGGDIVDRIPQGQLVLMAVFGGDPTVLYPTEFDSFLEPVRAFYWNPSGDALAWVVEVGSGDGDCASETSTLRWQFWFDNNLVVGPEFVPTATFACAYLPFFDQYGQSSTYWSPAGDAIVYAGTDVATGQRGIFTLNVNVPDAPQLVAVGEHAVWSPSSAGSAASDL